MIHLLDKKPSLGRGTVKIYKRDKYIGTYHNQITNEVAEFFTGWLSGDTDYQFTHIYGQWGTAINYPESGGPYITPDRADVVTDLTTATIFTTNAEVPIVQRSRVTEPDQSEFTNNIISCVGIFSNNDTQVYVGAGLVCKLPSGKELLLAHVPFNGILKQSSYDIVVVWDWLFTNN